MTSQLLRFKLQHILKTVLPRILSASFLFLFVFGLFLYTRADAPTRVEAATSDRLNAFQLFGSSKKLAKNPTGKLKLTYESAVLNRLARELLKSLLIKQTLSSDSSRNQVRLFKTTSTLFV